MENEKGENDVSQNLDLRLFSEMLNCRLLHTLEWKSLICPIKVSVVHTEKVKLVCFTLPKESNLFFHF